jgi:hypothetical protein
MDTYYQKGNRYEPEIKLEPTGLMSFKGISMPENTIKTYLKVIEWLNEYKISPAATTELIFDLNYLNTASSKMIHEILRIIDEISKRGFKASIVWIYHSEDSDILEIGEEFKDFVQSDFILKKK